MKKIRANIADLGDRIDVFPCYAGKKIKPPAGSLKVYSSNPFYKGAVDLTFEIPRASRIRVYDARVFFPNMVIDIDGEHWSDIGKARADSFELLAPHRDIIIPTGVTIPTNNNFTNYCHFLQECAPALRKLQSTPDVPGAIFPPISQEYQRTALDVFGFRPSHLTQLARGVFRFDYIDFFTFTDHSRHRHDLWSKALYEVVDKLRAKAGVGSSDLPKKIFISRRETPRRLCEDIDWLGDILAKEGFAEVNLTGMSLLDQVRLFSGATHVVAIHGAGLVNTMFCRPGTRVVELQPPNIKNTNFLRLSVQFELMHTLYQEFDEVGGLRSDNDYTWSIANKDFVRDLTLSEVSENQAAPSLISRPETVSRSIPTAI
ncbi:hypothetical protein SM0020_12185 [Sinorhizobium meliloti CCNWSX0020]|uniref:Glycosyltransferase 61 catalytic domain-containing protein n=1 Tax=Sinorhizobium meliloti CCNWSX0020 TaxID=1107881 RepID=H0FZ03_RHIML|nr:glycosyltransferase family 61 protein [Sinorhizobium meliloti]EHK77683.1 hypothetical protein SM0020_12185 [Sinorhizobium meliloti CCNWSX0020]